MNEAVSPERAGRVADGAGSVPPPTAVGRLRVILNRSAGSKIGPAASDPTAADIAALLDHVGIDAEIVESGSVDETRAVARAAAAAGAPALAVAGGDGTISVVAAELLGKETVLGILPLGSVMNIPRMLGLPRDLPAAATILANGAVRSVDVGRIRGRPFFETASVGMNAAVFSAASGLEDGERQSIPRTIWVAIRYRPSRMRIELDDRAIRTRALTVTVSNGPYTGTGMTVAPQARLDDGRLDVRIFERFSKLELVRHFASIAFGRRAFEPRVSSYLSRRVRVSSRRPLPVRADSRDFGTTPVELEVWPGALRVVVAPDGLPVAAGADGTAPGRAT